MALKVLTEKELSEAQAHICKHAYHFIDSMSLNCAVQLGIPDIIYRHNNELITINELASSLQIPLEKASALGRLMRLLVHNGIFATRKTNEGEEGYILTPSSMLLLKGNDGANAVTSLSPYVTLVLDPVLVSPWHSFADWFKTEQESVFQTWAGMDFYGYLERHPEFVGPFKTGMDSHSWILSSELKEQREVFEGIENLVDAGGGTGTVARMLCDTFPGIKCTVLDLPKVIENMEDTENLKFVEGDMMRFIPPADAVLIKSALQNWTDEDCIKVLKRCKEAISGKRGGKVIIVEVVMSDEEKQSDDATKVKLLLDTLMLILTKRRQRSEAEWEKLFMEAGFGHYKITAMPDSSSIIEVFP